MRRYLVSLMKWPGARMQAAAAPDFDLPPSDALFMCARKVPGPRVSACVHCECMCIYCMRRVRICARVVKAPRALRRRAMIMGDVWLLLPEPCAAQHTK